MVNLLYIKAIFVYPPLFFLHFFHFHFSYSFSNLQFFNTHETNNMHKLYSFNSSCSWYLLSNKHSERKPVVWRWQKLINKYSEQAELLFLLNILRISGASETRSFNDHSTFKSKKMKIFTILVQLYKQNHNGYKWA